MLHHKLGDDRRLKQQRGKFGRRQVRHAAADRQAGAAALRQNDDGLLGVISRRSIREPRQVKGEIGWDGPGQRAGQQGVEDGLGHWGNSSRSWKLSIT
jgi:hypothetical protein